jgi:hypothetical protein
MFFTDGPLRGSHAQRRLYSQDMLAAAVAVVAKLPRRNCLMVCCRDSRVRGQLGV